MNINEYSFPLSSNESNNNKNIVENKQNEINNIYNSIPQNYTDLNQINPENKENEIEDLDEIDDLKYKDNFNKNLNPFVQQRLDSCESKTNFKYKYSIDIPNVSKQRLHEYLNDDLLNALDCSPNIPNLSSGITTNKNISNDPKDNNINNDLIGFSLYGQSNDNNKITDNNNEKNINNLSDFNKINNLNEDNNNNLNNFQFYNFVNNNNLNLNYNKNNPQIYIPTKLRNNEKNNNQYQNYQNQIKEEENNIKNKFDNRNKKYTQNVKKERNRKNFEVREGDWTCIKCNNLNFSFRNKCNRCGLPKDLNTKFETMNVDMLNPNINYQFMNEINSNAIYMNNINNSNNMSINNNNVNNNNNGIKYFQK